MEFDANVRVMNVTDYIIKIFLVNQIANFKEDLS